MPTHAPNLRRVPFADTDWVMPRSLRPQRRYAACLWLGDDARKNWSNRPAYQFKIRHQFELGGFDVKAGPGIDLDPIGLEWMRTLELSSRTTGIGYRMMLFDDLDVILPGFPGPSPEMLEKMYGPRFDR